MDSHQISIFPFLASYKQMSILFTVTLFFYAKKKGGREKEVLNNLCEYLARLPNELCADTSSFSAFILKK